MRANSIVTPVHLVQPKQSWIVNGTNNIEAQIAGFFSRFSRIERNKFQEVVDTIRFDLETDNNHVHKFWRIVLLLHSLIYQISVRPNES